MKKYISTTLILIIGFSVSLISCTDDAATSSTHNISIEQSFLENLGKNYLEISELSPTISRAEIDTIQTGTSSDFIFIEFPENKPDEFKVITSANELIYLSKEFGAFLSDSNDGLYTDSIPVDIDRLKISMAPTIQSCKEYLNGLGMTNDEIELMLVENKVDDTYLIPLAYNLISHSEFEEGSGIILADATITGQEIADCALKALGVDIFQSVLTTSGTKWTKKAIMRAFKIISSKIVGPIGCIIAGVEFGYCIYEHW